MKIIAINGSPREDRNTATLLKKALEGAESLGANTKLIHLYRLNYKGCISCFACKQKGGKSYGRCEVNDALKAIFREIETADALILGSPIYLGNITGEMQSFLERLVFPYLPYTESPTSLFPKKIHAGFIYTMGVPEALMSQAGYQQRFDARKQTLTRIFGSGETLLCFDTLQFDDYSKFVATRFNAEAKAERHQQIFPQDCRKAFEMGARFVSKDQ